MYVCTQFHPLHFGCPLSRLPGVLLLNTSTIHYINMNNPIQPSYSGKWKHLQITKRHTEVDALQNYSTAGEQINFTLGILRARRTVCLKKESVK